MHGFGSLEERLTRSERRLLGQLASPGEIQAFLDGLAYNHENSYRCPLGVLRDRIGIVTMAPCSPPRRSVAWANRRW